VSRAREMSHTNTVIKQWGKCEFAHTSQAYPF
jgi:hypothetical protein